MMRQNLHASTIAAAAPLTAPRGTPPLPARPRVAEAEPPCFPASAGLLDPTTRAGRLLQRALECLPGLVTWLVITSLVWGALLLPRAAAVAVLAFDLFWLWLSYRTVWNAWVSWRRVRRARRTDWRHEYRVAQAFGRAFAAWEDIYHVVIIPNYKEPEALLRRTLASLAAQHNAAQIFVVLAMEARERGSGAKARRLVEEYRGRFAGMFATFHPEGLPGEVAGKSANENWAARIAKRRLVDELGYDLNCLTITSCDADTVFDPAYFACLTYKFGTDPRRYRRFWQSPIVLTNNIWETPAPLRVGSALSDIHILGNLSKRDRVVFPQSTYSLSLRMAHEVGYWDPDIIPEDWHMFLKCYYAFRGRVDVEPIYLPTGNDAVRAGGLWRTFVEAYRQKKRHAWGASDIPYAIRQMLLHGEIAPWRRVRRVIALTANHLLWTTNWFLLTLGWWLPLAMRRLVGMDVDVGHLHTLARLTLTACLLPYVASIVVSARFRPSKPAWWRLRHSLLNVAMWAALPITSFFFGALPALEAQTRLLLGKRLEYRCTAKV